MPDPGTDEEGPAQPAPPFAFLALYEAKSAARVVVLATLAADFGVVCGLEFRSRRRGRGWGEVRGRGATGRIAAMEDRPPPDPAKLLADWMEWERGETQPGRVMSNLKIHGLRDLLESLAEEGSGPDPE